MNEEKTKNGVPSGGDDTDLLRGYAGKWVVLSRDETEIMAVGANLSEAMRSIVADKVSDVVAKFVPCGATAMVL